MNDHNAIAPVIKRIDLDCPVEHAFGVFTRQLDTWWPLASHSCFADSAARVVIEERVGGTVWEIAGNGERAPWGEILEWQPPLVFAMTWHPASDPARATRLRVRFEALSNRRTRLELVHDGWQARGDTAGTGREGYDSGWDGVLRAYQACAVTRKTG
jgi:Activator of Hsp90 ATPase homolog 1-like protein